MPRESTTFKLFVRSTEGQKIALRADEFNVNFAEVKENGVFVRTYERGVEDETLSCGTGATAVAITASIANFCEPNFCQIIAPGGKLEVSFKKQSERLFTDVWLQGPTSCVYRGEINI